MATPQEIVESLSGFHQAALCKHLAITHKQQELEQKWDDILVERTQELLRVLLGRDGTTEELNDVVNPPYPEPPYET